MKLERRGFLASVAGAALALVGVRAKPKGITIDDCLEGARRVAEKGGALETPGHEGETYLGDGWYRSKSGRITPGW